MNLKKMLEVKWHVGVFRSSMHGQEFLSILTKRAAIIDPFLCIIIHPQFFYPLSFQSLFFHLSLFFFRKGILIFSPFFIFNFTKREGGLIKCLYLSERMSVSFITPLNLFLKRQITILSGPPVRGNISYMWNLTIQNFFLFISLEQVKTRYHYSFLTRHKLFGRKITLIGKK